MDLTNFELAGTLFMSFKLNVLKNDIKKLEKLLQQVLGITLKSI